MREASELRFTGNTKNNSQNIGEVYSVDKTIAREVFETYMALTTCCCGIGPPRRS